MVSETPVESRAALLTNLFARPDPECDTLPGARFAVWLDHADRVVSLPSAWESFAAMIGSPDLDRERVLGRPAGWFIENETVRECFRMMWERTRLEGRDARIVARCDGPDGKRALQLKFTPMPAGALECTWSIVHGTAAATTPVVRRRRFRDGEYLRMCSWCRQVHMGLMWQRLDSAAPALGLLDHSALPPITHGICPHCCAGVLEENAAAL